MLPRFALSHTFSDMGALDSLLFGRFFPKHLGPQA